MKKAVLAVVFIVGCSAGWGAGETICPGIDGNDVNALAVVTPQEDDVWVSGSRHTIRWHSCTYNGSADVLLSTDGGGSWEVIAENQPAAGSYRWRIPGLIDSNRCVIKVVPSEPDPNVVCIDSGIFTIHPDNPGPAVQIAWATKGRDPSRRGLSSVRGPETGCIKWQFETTRAVSGGVTAGPNETVYVPCEDGNLYCLDGGDGHQVWTFEANTPLVSAASIGPDGTAYVGGGSGKLYAVDKSGELRWTYQTAGPIYAAPAVDANGRVFLASEDGRLYALGADGSELWSFETTGFGAVSGAIIASPALGPDGTIYVGGLYDSNLYALEPNDGSVKWVHHFDSNGWCVASPVVGPNGTIYQVLVNDANLYAIDSSDGSVIWKTHLSEVEHWWYDYSYSRWFEPYSYGIVRHPAETWRCCEVCEYMYSGSSDAPLLYNLADSGYSEPAVGPDGTIYVSLDDPWLRAVEPNGAIKWAVELGYGGGLMGECTPPSESCKDPSYEGDFSLAVGSDGIIYAGGNDGNLYAVHPDGYELARFESNDSWLGFAVINGEDTVLVADERDNSWLVGQDKNKVRAISADCGVGPAVLYWQGGREDLNDDGRLDLDDYALFAQDWSKCTDCHNPACLDRDFRRDREYYGDINADRYIDFLDFALLAQRWLMGD